MKDPLDTLRGSGESADSRAAAASGDKEERRAESIPALIDELAQGDLFQAWAASEALIAIGSRRHGRRLVGLLRRDYPQHVRQAAIYAIWLLGETRGEQALIRIGDDLSENDTLRLMAVEALGNTCTREPSQRALARFVSDPSLNVRYSALCALSGTWKRLPDFLVSALSERLDDTASLYDEGDVARLARGILDRAK